MQKEHINKAAILVCVLLTAWGCGSGDSNGVHNEENVVPSDTTVFSSSKISTQETALDTVFKGSPTSLPEHHASFLDMEPPFNFRKGDSLIISTDGDAHSVRIRLLDIDDGYDSHQGVLGKYSVKKNKVSLTIKSNYTQTKQLSLHGGRNPWGLGELGEGNGTPEIQEVRLIRYE